MFPQRNEILIDFHIEEMVNHWYKSCIVFLFFLIMRHIFGLPADVRAFWKLKGEIERRKLVHRCGSAPRLGVSGRTERLRRERSDYDRTPTAITACSPTAAMGRPDACLIQAESRWREPGTVSALLTPYLLVSKPHSWCSEPDAALGNMEITVTTTSVLRFVNLRPTSTACGGGMRSIMLELLSVAIFLLCHWLI